MSGIAKSMWIVIGILIVSMLAGGVAADLHLQHLADAANGIAAFAVLMIIVIGIAMIEV